MAEHNAAGRAAAATERMVDELKRRGARLTPQRQLILEAICDGAEHTTAESILARVRAQFPGVNISTVYRNLDLLEEMGMVRHVHLGHSVGHYHAATDDGHQHLVCRSCGSVEEIDIEVMEPLRAEALSRRGFEVDATHFALYGLCSRCR